MKLIFRFCLLSLCLQLLLAPCGACANDQPNVLFIAVDDLRPELNCYGAKHITSPNIDRFAASGVQFNRAYCQQSVCNPSRTSLMTGMRPDSIGVTGNHSHFRTDHPNVVTLPQHFKNHGYFTQAIGKLFHGVFPEGSSNTKWDTMGDAQSWSVPAIRFGPRYYYTETGVAAAKATYQKVYKPTNPGPDDWTQKLVFGPATESPDVSDNTLYDGLVADSAIQALRKLKQNPDQPFFLAVGFIKPHSPYIAPKKYFELYEDVNLTSDDSLPAGAPIFAGHGSGELRRYTDQPGKGPIPEQKQKRIRQAYYACVSYIDAQIGRVLDELNRLDLDKNTIVSLYGDHGYHLGEQGLWGKTTNFELDTRVPLILRVPGMKHKETSCSSLVELLDLYPTLSELAGLPLSQQLEGTSLVPILKGRATKTKEVALSQYPRKNGLMGYSMRNSTYRLTQWIDTKSGEIKSSELYEYPDDRTVETRNLANDDAHQANFKALSKQLAIEFCLPAISHVTKKKTKVACIGDSITYGYGIENREDNSYPGLLQKMLGEDYEVENFGSNGATLLKHGHKPYWQKPVYPQSLEFDADIVVINLGANDAINTNWRHAGQFAADYQSLIESYRARPAKPKIFICEILPIFSHHPRYDECRTNRRQLVPLIRDVARKTDSILIDLNSPFVAQADSFPDGLHPNANGAITMAGHIFTALTGQRPPPVAIFENPPFTAEHGTSFEDTKSGPFEITSTRVGTWKVLTGKASIVNQHSKSGKQCLHLHGSQQTTVELELGNTPNPGDQLSFAAERWTRRSPFEFRISQRSNGIWSEIYKGDDRVKVGRAFLSDIAVPLNDPDTTHLKFSVSSPANTGILIDDLKIASAAKQQVTKTEVVPLALPVLVGNEACALLKLKINAAGSLDPVFVTEITSLLNGTDRENIESVQIYFGGSNSNFSSAKQFGTDLRANKNWSFAGNRHLLRAQTISGLHVARRRLQTLTTWSGQHALKSSFPTETTPSSNRYLPSNEWASQFAMAVTMASTRIGYPDWQQPIKAP